MWAGLSDWLPRNRSHGMSLPWLSYKLWLLSLSLSRLLQWSQLLYYGEAHGTRNWGKLPSVTNKELRRSSQQPPGNWILSTGSCMSLEADPSQVKLAMTGWLPPCGRFLSPLPPSPQSPLSLSSSPSSSPPPSHLVSSCFMWASLVAQTVKNPPAKQETKVGFLGGEDPLEKGMATHSSILAWRIPQTEDPGGCRPWGCKESDMTERLTRLVHTLTMFHVDQWFATFVFKLKCSIFK